VDGHTVLRFASDVFADTIVSFARSVTKDTHGADYMKPIVGKNVFFKAPSSQDKIKPKKMNFELSMEHMKSIHYSETSISDQVMQNELRVLEFKSFGKRWIKSRKISPDAFVQVAMCVSHFILYGEFASQYESVMTKYFLHGRTEAARSCTEEAKIFAQAWLQMAMSLSGKEAGAAGISKDSNLDNAVGENQAEQLRTLFRNAVTAQQNMARQCSQGLGVDRHLYGLKQQSLKHLGHANQSVFTSPAYKKLTNTILSTSNCGNPSLRLFGFGPVSPEGYGIGYIIKDDGIQFCVSSKHRQTARYIMTLQKFLNGMQELLHEDAAQTVVNMNSDEIVKDELKNDEDTGGYDSIYGISEMAFKQYEIRQATLQATGETLTNVVPVAERASSAPESSTWSAANVSIAASKLKQKGRRSVFATNEEEEVFGY